MKNIYKKKTVLVSEIIALMLRFNVFAFSAEQSKIPSKYTAVNH